MNIQTVEQKTGLTKRMIRHYEELGLIKPKRDENNYREYCQEDVDNLRCIKSMRDVGFSLEEIGKIFKEGKTEEVLRRHLNELLCQQQESYRAQKERLLTIKQLLNSKKDDLVSKLLDQIALAYSPNMRAGNVDNLEDFFRKNQVVHGYIKPVEELKQKAVFGFHEEFKITEVTYTTYQRVFEENIFPRASISLCNQLYSYFLLFTETDSKFESDFHKRVLQQFSESWNKISWELTAHLEALTEDMGALEKIFSMFDLAACITAQNSNGEKLCLVLPGQSLVVYLGQKEALPPDHFFKPSSLG